MSRILYPNTVLENSGWVANADTLFKDGMPIFSTDNNAVIRLGLPFPAVNCEIRVRSARGRGTMRLCFYLGDTLIAVQTVIAPIHWSVFRLPVGVWDSVEIVADKSVDLSFLRAQEDADDDTTEI